MPNHVTHICTVIGSSADIEAFRAKHLNGAEGREFDFDTVIPRPESIRNTEAGTQAELWFFALTGTFAKTGKYAAKNLRSYGCVPSHINTAVELQEWLEKTSPDTRKHGEAAMAALRETGFSDWYDWCCAKWGTKWGTYHVEIRECADTALTFKFETAWSFPRPVFEKLARLHPGLIFDVKSFDEGWNFGCVGQFNGRNDFAEVKATPELYEAVYGKKYEPETGD